MQLVAQCEREQAAHERAREGGRGDDDQQHARIARAGRPCARRRANSHAGDCGVYWLIDFIWELDVSYEAYHKRKIGEHLLKPETQMMGFGFDPTLSEGALKPPIFLTSTFVFKSAQDGKDFFDYTSGRREPVPGQSSGLVYSRFNNPNLEVLEDRLALWEEGEAAAVFSSGMSAISTVIWTHVRPGDVILMSQPLYGGTETLIEKTLPAFGVTAESFTEGHDRAAVEAAGVRASERAA